MNAGSILLAVLVFVGSSCSTPSGQQDMPHRRFVDGVEADKYVFEECQKIASELETGWRVFDYPKGAAGYNTGEFDWLTWVFTEQSVEVDCFRHRKVAVNVVESADGAFTATLDDLTNQPEVVVDNYSGGPGWTGGIDTFNSGFGGRFYDQKLYLFLLVGEFSGERRVSSYGWLQVCRDCPKDSEPAAP